MYAIILTFTSAEPSLESSLALSAPDDVTQVCRQTALCRLWLRGADQKTWPPAYGCELSWTFTFYPPSPWSVIFSCILSSLSVFVSTTTSVGVLWPGSDTRRFHSQSVGKDDSRGRPQTRRQLGSGQRGAQEEEDVDFDDARALSATIVLSVIVRTTNNI